MPCKAKPPLHPPDAREALGIRPFLSLPLHVIALDGRRKDSQNFVVHQARALPDGSLRTVAINGIEASVFVVCPELMFVQMAASFRFARSVYLGYELCGTFAPDKGNPYVRDPENPSPRRTSWRHTSTMQDPCAASNKRAPRCHTC